jgi:hypothetical protein
MQYPCFSHAAESKRNGGMLLIVLLLIVNQAAHQKTFGNALLPRGWRHILGRAAQAFSCRTGRADAPSRTRLSCRICRCKTAACPRFRKKSSLSDLRQNADAMNLLGGNAARENPGEIPRYSKTACSQGIHRDDPDEARSVRATRPITRRAAGPRLRSAAAVTMISAARTCPS